jgi:hypothetical protein
LLYLSTLIFGFFGGKGVQTPNNPISRSRSNLPNYDPLFSLFFRITTRSKLSNVLSLSLGFNKLRTILISIFSVTTVGLILMLSIYLLVLVFYKSEIILPSFLNFGLIGTTVFLFSLLNSNLLTDKNFIDFLISLTQVNYNNIEESQGTLNLQEKYFLKHESTYFTDKKCSES